MPLRVPNSALSTRHTQFPFPGWPVSTVFPLPRTRCEQSIQQHPHPQRPTPNRYLETLSSRMKPSGVYKQPGDSTQEHPLPWGQQGTQNELPLITDKSGSGRAQLQQPPALLRWYPSFRNKSTLMILLAKSTKVQGVHTQALETGCLDPSPNYATSYKCALHFLTCKIRIIITEVLPPKLLERVKSHSQNILLLYITAALET